MCKEKLKIPLLTLILLSTHLPVAANSEVLTLSRYTAIEVNSELTQQNPLKMVVAVKFPPMVNTTGAALNYVLDGSGYKLISIKNTSRHTRTMYETGLAEVHRQFEYVTLENILKTLAGDAFVLLSDPVSRRLSLESLIPANLEGPAQ